jgi:hypothetical protein
MRSLCCGERAILCQDGPEDEAPPFRVLEHRRRLTARKHHNCSGCDGGWIEPGEHYDRLVGLNDEGRFEINRYCMLPYCGRSARTWEARAQEAHL